MFLLGSQTPSPGVSATPGGAASAPGGIEAPPENRDQQVEGNGASAEDGSNNAWEQYNIGLFVKLFLLLFLFDAGREVYLMTLVLLLLHINGFFGPLIGWMRESSHPQPLEVVRPRETKTGYLTYSCSDFTFVQTSLEDG